MLTEKEILAHLSLCWCNPGGQFIELFNPEQEVLQYRLHVFRGKGDNWAIIAEVIRHIVASGMVELVLYHFGNCLRSTEDRPGNTDVYPGPAFANRKQLFRRLPVGIIRLMLLTRWYHKDFRPVFSVKVISHKPEDSVIFAFTGSAGSQEEDMHEVKELLEEMLVVSNQNVNHFIACSPVSYETWWLIARVIVTRKPQFYLPTVRPNTPTGELVPMEVVGDWGRKLVQ